MCNSLQQLHSLTGDCTWTERWQRYVSILLPIPIVFWATFGPPKLYLRYRNILMVLIRVVFFSFPLLRRARGIQRVLDSPANQIPYIGYCLDILKIGWGSRLMAIVFSGVSMQIPIELHVPVQLYSIYMVLSNNTLCASTLCTDPLTISRFKSTMYILSPCFLPISAVPSIPFTADINCTAILTSLHLLFGLVATSIFSKSFYKGKYVLLKYYFSKNRTEAFMAWWITLQLLWSISVAIAKFQSS